MSVLTEIVGVLDNVRSRYNVGAIFRTADGLGVSKLYLCGITPKPDREEDRIGIAKTALGAEQTVDWEGASDTTAVIARLKKEGYVVVALETDVNGVSLSDLREEKTVHLPSVQFSKMALVVGHEVYGIRHSVLDQADVIAEIPMHGTKRSLNVEVSFALGAYTIQTASKI